MLSIQYLLFTPKCVSCSKVEIFTHSWTRYTVSKTPQKHEELLHQFPAEILSTLINKCLITERMNIMTNPKKYDRKERLITDRGKSWAGDRISSGESSSGPKPQSWSHRGYPERERMSGIEPSREMSKCHNFDFRILWLNSNPVKVQAVNDTRRQPEGIP